MKKQTHPYEIREVGRSDGGLTLELTIEGARLVRASANEDVIEQMKSQFGFSRQDVVEELRRSLESYLKNQLAIVKISDPEEDPVQRLRFVSRFSLLSRENNDIRAGVVWYDVPGSTTGPEDLPAIVRNRMRLEVHQKLTSSGSEARGLVELLR